MDLDNLLGQFQIPQVDGGGYDKDDDYAAAEDMSSSSESEYSVLESGSGDDDEDAHAPVIKSNNSRGSSLKHVTNDLPLRRVTRQQGQKKPGKVGRPSKTNLGTQEKQGNASRTLRSLATNKSSDDGQAEENKFLCKNCKKGFPGKPSLTRHLYWCDPLRMTRSRTGDVRKLGRPSNTTQRNNGTKSKRAQKTAQATETLEKKLKSKTRYQEELVEEPNEKLSYVSGTEKTSTELEQEESESDESDYETKLAFVSEVQPVSLEKIIDIPERGVSNPPATCPKCKMTYRNQDSLQKHIITCTYSGSSSGSSSSSSEDEAENLEVEHGLDSSSQIDPMEQEMQHFSKMPSNLGFQEKLSSTKSTESAPSIDTAGFESAHSSVSNYQTNMESAELICSQNLSKNIQFPIEKNYVQTIPMENQNCIQKILTINAPITSGYTITEANNPATSKFPEAIDYAQRYNNPEPSTSVVLRNSLLNNTANANTVNSVQMQNYKFPSFNEIPSSKPMQVEPETFQAHQLESQWGAPILDQYASSQQHGDPLQSSSSSRDSRFSGVPSSSVISMQTSSALSAQPNSYHVFQTEADYSTLVSSSRLRQPPNYPLQYNGNEGLLETRSQGSQFGLPPRVIQHVQPPAQPDPNFSAGYSQDSSFPNEISVSALQSEYISSLGSPAEAVQRSQPVSQSMDLKQQQPVLPQQNVGFGGNSSGLSNTGMRPSPYYQPQTPSTSSYYQSQQNDRFPSQLPHCNSTQVVYYQDSSNGQIYKMNVPMNAQASVCQPSFCSDQLQSLGSNITGHSVQKIQQLSLPQSVPQTLTAHQVSPQAPLHQQQFYQSQPHFSQLQPSQMQFSQHQPSQINFRNQEPCQGHLTQPQPPKIHLSQQQPSQMNLSQLQASQMNLSQLQDSQINLSQLQTSQMNLSQLQASQMHLRQHPSSLIHLPSSDRSQIQISQQQHPTQVSQKLIQIPQDQSQIQISHQHQQPHIQLPEQQLTPLQQSQIQISQPQQQSQTQVFQQQSQIQLHQPELLSPIPKSDVQSSQMLSEVVPRMQISHQQGTQVLQKLQPECNSAYNTLGLSLNDVQGCLPNSSSTQIRHSLEQNVGTPMAPHGDSLHTNSNLINLNQPYQMIQMPDGTTYIVVQPGNATNISIDNIAGQGSNESVSNSIQQQNPSEMANVPISYGMTPSNGSNQNFMGTRSSNAGQINFARNIDPNIPCTSNSSQAHPCPCSRCSLRVAANTAADKYRKVLPFPRPIEPKLQQSGDNRPSPVEVTPGFVKTYMRRNLNKLVKCQLASMIMEKQGVNPNSVQISESILETDEALTISAEASSSIQASRKNHVLTAVVRPMEHPLQKMSDQISQIESTFNSSGAVPANPLTGHIQAVEVSSRKESSGISTNNIIRQEDSNVPISISNSISTECLVSRQETQMPTVSPELTALVHAANSDTEAPSTPTRPIAKRKVDQVGESSPAKSIKVTLRRKEGGDSYSIKDIRETGASSTGAMRSLKIKGKITSGEFAGTSTDVVVEPRIHIVPIPDPDSEDLDSNLTIDEDSPIVDPIITSIPMGEHDSVQPRMRLTHRAVVVYDVKDSSSVLYRSSDVRAVWSHIFETVQGTRLNHNLPPLSYPATNISLSENKQEPTTTFNMLGLTHRAVQFLLQHLPKKKAEAEKNKLLLESPTPAQEDDSTEINETGCTRTEGYMGRKPFDMFGWLASKHRKPLDKISMSEEGLKSNGICIAPRFRNIKEKTEKTLTVLWSTIHGRGLYTKRAIEKGEMIIEYAGEVIRSLVCDQREIYYETKGIGCYMFRINYESVIDATMKGNAARFINHSCDPNCESKSIKILGKEHILIFALRKISSGEELTYDYKFEKEEVKIPCSCASKKCRKYLN